MRRNTIILLAAATSLIAGAAVGIAVVSSSPPVTTTPVPTRVGAVVEVREVIATPFVMFRTLAPHHAHGRIAMVPRDSTRAIRYLAPLSCARVQYAAGSGLCMVEESQGTTVKNVIYTFDRAFVRGARIELTGIPIRVRVAPNGRIAAVTVYAEEESPAGERLASETTLIEIASGRVLADLREFSVSNPSHPPIEGPVDISGVTFQSDSDGFFATLATSTTRYLVSGSVEGRRLTVQRVGVANEALSPDGRRLLAKKQTGDHGFWQLLVIDLESGIERALRQGPRSIDDQVEWLDAEHVVYHEVMNEGTGLWVLPTDGITGPSLLVPDAFSPAVQQ